MARNKKSNKKSDDSSYDDRENWSYDATFCSFMRDSYAGSEVIKDADGDKGSSTYLLCPAGYSDKEWEAYIRRAHYPGVVKQTVKGLVERAFNEEFELEIQSALEADSFDTQGRKFSKFLKETFREFVHMGAAAIMLDFDEEGMPKTPVYRREDILDWHFAKGKLQMVVLVENETELDADFNKVLVMKHRLLALDENGDYFSQLFVKNESNGKYTPEERQYPTDGANNIDRILFFPFGDLSENGSLVDELAKLALDYYDQSAQLRFASSKVGSPTPVVVWGVQASEAVPWIQEMKMGGDFHIGSSKVVNLPPGSSFTFSEITGSGVKLFREELTNIVQMMVAAGAKTLVDTSRGNVNEQTVRMQMSAEISTVSEAVISFETVWNELFSEIGILTRFKAPMLKMSRNFMNEKLTPADIAQLVSSWIAGGFPKVILYEAMRRSGWTSLTDEMMDELIEEEAASMLPGPSISQEEEDDDGLSEEGDDEDGDEGGLRADDDGGDGDST